MARGPRIVGFVAFIAALVVLFVLVPARMLSNDPAPSPADAISAAAGEIERASSQLSSEAAHETEPQRAIAPNVDALRLHVVDFGGQPHASATVVVTRDEKVLAHGETDANGSVALATSSDVVDVLVLDKAHVPLGHEFLDRATGVQTIRLPERVTLNGRVLVDEQPPTRSLHLVFMGKAEQGPPPYAPKFVYEQLGWPIDPRAPWIEVDTQGAGQFHVDGLHPSWRGRVKFEPMFLPQDGDGWLTTAVTDVRNELLIRLKSYAVVTGRIVAGPTRAPVPDVTGQFERICPSDQTWDEVASDDEGRFSLRLQCQPVTKLTFSFAVENLGRASRELVDVPAEGLDLGDVPLENAFDLRMRVQDSAGKPIAQATAFLTESPQIQSEPSDSGGVCKLAALAQETREVRVAAFGYFEAIVPIDPATVRTTEPLVVVMRPMTMLEISARAQEGGVLAGLVARVRTWDPEPFETTSGRSAWTDEVQVDGAGGVSKVTRESGGVEPAIDARFAIANDVVRIGAFRPRARTRISVEDGVGTELASRELTPSELDDGESVAFLVDRMLRTLELTIVDAHDKPVRGAYVFGVSRMRSLAWTREDGRATLRSLGTDRIDLQIEAQGYSRATILGVALDAPVVSRRIVLEPGSTVRVVTTDPRGRAVIADAVSARIGTQPIGRVTRCPDEPCHLIEDLGAETVEIVVAVGGRVFKKPHDPHVGVAQIEVPEHGGLRVEFGSWLTPPALYRMKIHDEQDPAIVLVQSVVPESRSEFVNVPVVFPGSYTVELEEIDADGGQSKGIVARAEHVVVKANEWSSTRLAKP